MANRDLSSADWLRKAQTYCAAAEHCKAEVMEKFRQWSTLEALIPSLIEQLYAQSFLDDDRYCRAFVHDKVLYQGWGRRKIEAALRQRNLPAAAISQGFAALSDDEYRDVLRRIIQKKKGATYEQMARFLLQRGFTYDDFREELSSR